MLQWDRKLFALSPDIMQTVKHPKGMDVHRSVVVSTVPSVPFYTPLFAAYTAPNLLQIPKPVWKALTYYDFCSGHVAMGTETIKGVTDPKETFEIGVSHMVLAPSRRSLL